MTAKVRFGVNCPRHGAESPSWAGKQVIVPRPLNKAQRLRGGCPHCRAEETRDKAS